MRLVYTHEDVLGQTQGCKLVYNRPATLLYQQMLRFYGELADFAVGIGNLLFLAYPLATIVFLHTWPMTLRRLKCYYESELYISHFVYRVIIFSLPRLVSDLLNLLFE